MSKLERAAPGLDVHFILSSVGVVAATGLLVLLLEFERTREAALQPAPALEPAILLRAAAPKSVDTAPMATLDELIAEAERLYALARYPHWSQPLELLGDALAEEQALHVQSSGAPGELVLTVYADHRTFDCPEPVLLHAHVVTAAGPMFADITASVFDSTGQQVSELLFRRDVDGYVASFAPPASSSPNASYSVHVRAAAAHLEPREATLEITYNQPYAHLTGNFRDRVERGDLIIEAQVSVQHAAEFRIDGSLYGAADQQQIAWAEATAKLPVGTSWLPLKFHGLILREQQVAGPYLLRYAALTQRTRAAEATMRALQNAYTTQPYDADTFDGEAHRDARLLAAAAHVRTHIAHLQRQLRTE